MSRPGHYFHTFGHFLEWTNLKVSPKKCPSICLPDCRRPSKPSIAHISRKFRYKMNTRRKHVPSRTLFSYIWTLFGMDKFKGFAEKMSINLPARLSATLETIDRSYFAEISIQNEYTQETCPVQDIIFIHL